MSGAGQPGRPGEPADGTTGGAGGAGGVGGVGTETGGAGGIGGGGGTAFGGLPRAWRRLVTATGLMAALALVLSVFFFVKLDETQDRAAEARGFACERRNEQSSILQELLIVTQPGLGDPAVKRAWKMAIPKLAAIRCTGL